MSTGIMKSMPIGSKNSKENNRTNLDVVQKIAILPISEKHIPIFKLLDTPRLSITKPLAMPYKVTKAPRVPYNVPAWTSEYPKSALRKSVNIWLNEK